VTTALCSILLSCARIHAFSITSVRVHTRPVIKNWSRTGSAPRITCLFEKNWDKILAEEDDDQGKKMAQIPFDMRYNQRNCERAQKTFAAIRSAGPGAPAADIYGCDSASAKNGEAIFWYLGKVAHVSDVSLEQCVARQWPLIQQHASNLRPLELFPAWTNDSLELWCAPADSEMDVAYNRPEVTFAKMTDDVPGADKIKTNLIGFQGEVYEGGEEGFRSFRKVSDGSPARPEITGSPVQQDEVDAAAAGDALDRPPTDEEMQRLEEMLQRKDINELYEEQERRRRNEGD